jgi:hypothetical protein
LALPPHLTRKSPQPYVEGRRVSAAVAIPGRTGLQPRRTD